MKCEAKSICGAWPCPSRSELVDPPGRPAVRAVDASRLATLIAVLACLTGQRLRLGAVSRMPGRAGPQARVSWRGAKETRQGRSADLFCNEAVPRNRTAVDQGGVVVLLREQCPGLAW